MSRSKKITVDSKSMVGLKAILADHEAKRIIAGNMDGFASFSSKRCSSGIQSVRGARLPVKKQDVFERKNKGVDERNERDAMEKQEHEEVQKSSLALKAQLYDHLRDSTDLNKSGFLVDFHTYSDKGTSSSEPVSHYGENQSVCRCAVPKVNASENGKRRREEEELDSTAAPSGPWQWGSGRPAAPDLDEDGRDHANAKRLREKYLGVEGVARGRAVPRTGANDRDGGETRACLDSSSGANTGSRADRTRVRKSRWDEAPAGLPDSGVP